MQHSKCQNCFYMLLHAKIMRFNLIEKVQKLTHLFLVLKVVTFCKFHRTINGILNILNMTRISLKSQS